MSQHQRDVLRAIRSAGGTAIRVTPGGRHWIVVYTLNGEPRRHIMRRGTRVPPHAITHLVAELRRHQRGGRAR
jgi:hypothetical protein